MTTSLVGVSGAAILSVYIAGYFNTQSATTQLAANSAGGIDSSSQPPATTTAPTADPGSRVQNGPLPSRGGDDQGESGGGERSRNATPQVTPPAATPAPGQSTSGASQAPATTAPVAPSPTPTKVPAASGFRDGTFVGVGNSRHGGIQVSIVVKGGKITSASVTGCGTRYPCSKVNPLVGEVVSRQGPPVDYVSGATDSSMAYIQAVRTALSQASAPA